MCGENQVVRRTRGACLGSPPRVRGKLELHAEVMQHFGITPACAGKTWRCSYCLPLKRDHPRVCGENKYFLKSLDKMKGSPPRVRGKHSVMLSCKLREGITPACAGKTNAAGMCYICY